MLRLLLPRGLQVMQYDTDSKASIVMLDCAEKAEHQVASMVTQLLQLMSQPFIEQAGNAPCGMQRQKSSPPHAFHAA